MILANFDKFDNKMKGPVIVDGENYKLLFELDAIFKTFLTDEDIKELFYAVYDNNFDVANKQTEIIDYKKVNACVEILKKGKANIW